MRRLGYILIAFLYACSSENANDCFQTAGSLVQHEIMVPDFTKILVNRDIELVLTEGPETSVLV